MPHAPRKKVLLVANTSWYLYNFRRPLARELAAQGLEPVLMGPRDAYSQRLLDEGFQWRELDVPRNRNNPVTEAIGLARFIATYLRERPVAAHHFTIKCVIYGTIASICARVPTRINAITGLGHVFLSNGWKAKLLRPLLTLAYRGLLSSPRGRVIFQNEDDRGFFVSSGLVPKDRTRLICSSGVDLDAFAPQPRSEPGRVHVVFASRLLAEKGVFELIDAIRLLQGRMSQPPEFTLAGDTAAGNPSSVTAEQIADWQSQGLARFPGHVDGMAPLLAQADIVVLPSYREGTPRILLEACAMERAIVTTDVPGCREAVKHEVNGLLVPVRDAAALAAAIERLALDAGLRERMGKAGRKKAEAEFSDREIARQTVSVYREIGALGPITAPDR